MNVKKAAGLLALLLLGAPLRGRELRVCSDPNNLPFSNRKSEGFENRIAELVAKDLGATLRYTWWAERRGFFRNTLKAGLCDVVLGVPTGTEMALPTRPYYRSTYVFVSRKDRGLSLHSFDDPALKKLRIGVQIIGNDYANAPPAHALSNRGIVGNVVGYTVYGNYAEESPPSRIVRAVANRDVDVAVVWGPLAGYYARRQKVPLVLVPVSPQIDLPFLPFVYDIAIGVRRGEKALRDEIDAVLLRRQGEIAAILDRYGVPRVGVGERRTAP
ncbi:MAG TPA: substrate-binding domain-containing protein [Thermoanaerobaculia bacterium]|nr:substrate-binding domain-containing protein [Thermoanaerobaculia bacterium]